MIILAIDPSGNFNEGKGTTGYAVVSGSVVLSVGEIAAKDFETIEEYWNAHVEVIGYINPAHIVIESYRLYNHKGQEANKQANSELETPQIIGVLRMAAWRLGIPYKFQSAAQAKTRWSDKVLQNIGVLDEKNRFKGEQTNKHKRDAIRHGLHFSRYGL